MNTESNTPTPENRCPQCGLIQGSSPTCPSCGASRNNPSPAEQQSPQQSPIHQIRFHGSNGSLLEIQAPNVFFILITFGIYYFWAKARIRSYLLSQTEFQGDRFAYHGTGKEQLIGFLKAALLFGGLSLVLKLVPLLPGGERVQIAFSVAGYVIFLGFIAVARVGARRYRLSRISWRNIRFSFRGSSAGFIKLYVTGFLLSIFTLGLYYPFFRYKQDTYFISHSYFGNRGFNFDGEVKDLYKIYFQSSLFFIVYILIIGPSLWLLGLVMAGLSRGFSSATVGTVGFIGLTLVLTTSFSLPWSFLMTEQQKYFWKHVSFGAARFNLEVTFGPFLRVKLGNILLFIFTFGLAWPWITARNIRFLLDHLTVTGDLNIDNIQQETQTALPFGDEFDTFLDLDLGSGIG